MAVNGEGCKMRPLPNTAVAAANSWKQPTLKGIIVVVIDFFQLELGGIRMGD